MSTVETPSARTRGHAVEGRLSPHYRLHAGSDGAHDEGSDARKRPRVRYMPPLEAPLLSQIATMSGFLKKQADNEPGRWTQYYFVLKPATCLYYYNTELDAVPRGIIDVEFLTDVRFNTECVQRSVGASANGFRITGQLPSQLCGDNATAPGLASQLRPVYLDAESRELADAWMDAIRYHRFDVGHYKEYADLFATMDIMDKRLTSLTKQISDLTSTSQRILNKGNDYLHKLRGEETPLQDDDETTSHCKSPRGEHSVETVLQSMSVLLDDIFAEAERHRRLAELLREREADHFQREAQLDGCQADLIVQTARCQTLERDIERLMAEQRVQAQVYEGRLADVLSREHHVGTREKELEALVKQRDREYDRKMQETGRRAAELAKDLKKETTRCYGDLEKQRKALDKQQKVLDQRQKVLDKKLKDSPALKLGLLEAVHRSLAISSSREHGRRDPSVSDQDDRGELATTVECLENQAYVGCNLEEATIEGQASAIERPETTQRVPECSIDEYALTHPTPSESLEQKAEAEPGVHGVENGAPTGEPQHCVEAPFIAGDSSAKLLPTIDVRVSLQTQHTAGDVVQSSSAPASAACRSALLTESPLEGGTDMMSRLPPEWTCKESKSYQGRVYYFNLVTGETRWDFPLDVALEDPVSMSRDGSEPPDAEELDSDRMDYLSSGQEDSVTSQCDVSPAASVESKNNQFVNKLLAKVYPPKGAQQTTSSSPRSLLNRSPVSEHHRFEF